MLPIRSDLDALLNGSWDGRTVQGILCCTGFPTKCVARTITIDFGRTGKRSLKIRGDDLDLSLPRPGRGG